MSENEYLRLVSAILPPEINEYELKRLVPAHDWEESPMTALYKALQNCQKIDWEAYLARNPDIKAAKIDPLQHFVNNGIFEGRALVARHPLSETSISPTDAPMVSIIIPNYNNVAYLSKSLLSG